jgi:hypothetical protein
MSQPPKEPPEWGHLKRRDAVETWLYLRLAMLVLVLGLAASVLYERAQTTCFEPSISAYYYTPARGYFVGALVGIAVCLVCLRGSTPIEGHLLNLAGMFAPVVAFVPTPTAGTCTSVHSAAENRAANIANNYTALLAAGGVALAIALFIVLRHGSPRGRLAAALAGGVWVAALLTFNFAPHFLDRHGHDVAAGALFFCLIVVAADNGIEYRRGTKGRTPLNVYTAIAALMSLAGLYFIFGEELGSSHATIESETALIALFAAFWLRQTIELRTRGLRPPHPPPPPPPPPAG